MLQDLANLFRHDLPAQAELVRQPVGTVKAEGDGEEAIIGTDGLIYVNSEDTAEVVVFDPKSLEVMKRFPIGTAAAGNPSTARNPETPDARRSRRARRCPATPFSCGLQDLFGNRAPLPECRLVHP